MNLPPKVTDRAFARLAEIGASDQGQALRVAVEGGGCSGFQYTFDLETVVNDDDVVIEPLSIGFAQGTATGRARIEGAIENRRLGFDINLKEANLREASVILDHYSSLLRGEPPPTTSEYVEQTAEVFANIDVSAEGDIYDPYSYNGTGSANLKGPGLGEVRLLGLLSYLINFTALDFTLADDEGVDQSNQQNQTAATSDEG